MKYKYRIFTVEIVSDCWDLGQPLRSGEDVFRFAIGVIMLILNQFGVTETSTVLDLVTALVTAIGVWAVPNKTPIGG